MNIKKIKKEALTSIQKATQKAIEDKENMIRSFRNKLYKAEEDLRDLKNLEKY